MPKTLDTQNLEKIEDTDLPSYLAPSLKIALEAIPYELTLPNYFPFGKEKHLNVSGIIDYGNKRKVLIRLNSILQEKPEIIFWITASNFNSLNNNYSNKILLKDGTTSYLLKEENKVRLSWYKNSKTFHIEIEYINNSISTNSVPIIEKELLKVANSML